jgi:hypothetical protein
VFLRLIVTIAAGFLGSFNYKEDAVRHELTANALWNEFAKYQSRAEPYNGEESDDTSAFMNNVCRIVDSELRNWSALVQESSHVDKNHLDDGKPNSIETKDQTAILSQASDVGSKAAMIPVATGQDANPRDSTDEVKSST